MNRPLAIALLLSSLALAAGCQSTSDSRPSSEQVAGTRIDRQAVVGTWQAQMRGASTADPLADYQASYQTDGSLLLRTGRRAARDELEMRGSWALEGDVIDQRLETLRATAAERRSATAGAGARLLERASGRFKVREFTPTRMVLESERGDSVELQR